MDEYLWFNETICKQVDTVLQPDFPGSSVVKNLPAPAGDVDSIPQSGRSLQEGNGNPFQYSCPEMPWTEENDELQSMMLGKSQT